MHNVLHRKKTLQVLPDTAANGTQSIELVTWYGKLSPLAESFRSTLASIVLRPAGGGGLPKVLVITSPNGQEGKSTVAVNLAIALLELNRRVLLVDADLRRPRLHEIFHLSNDEGLTDLTEGDKPLQHVAAYSAIKATHLPGLSVLTSGPTTSTIGNILYSERLRELLRALRQEYDVVLIDTPPMLQFSDARVLAHLGDAAILVLRAGSTDRDSALAARQRLVEDGTRLLGTVLNDWRTRRKQDLYYQQYYNQTR